MKTMVFGTCLILPTEKEQPISLWRQQHLPYLNEYRRTTYTTLPTSIRLNGYLSNMDKQAEDMSFRLAEQMKQPQSIMEHLKNGKRLRTSAEKE